MEYEFVEGNNLVSLGSLKVGDYFSWKDKSGVCMVVDTFYIREEKLTNSIPCVNVRTGTLYLVGRDKMVLKAKVKGKVYI